jgi:hypothetical protein
MVTAQYTQNLEFTKVEEEVAEKSNIDMLNMDLEKLVDVEGRRGNERVRRRAYGNKHSRKECKAQYSDGCHGGTISFCSPRDLNVDFTVLLSDDRVHLCLSSAIYFQIKYHDVEFILPPY